MKIKLSQKIELRETFPRNDPEALKEWLIWMMFSDKPSTRLRAAELYGKMIGALGTPAVTSKEQIEEGYESSELSDDPEPLYGE